MRSSAREQEAEHDPAGAGAPPQNHDVAELEKILAAGDPTARRLTLAFDLFRLVVWCVVGMLVYPRVFEYVGARDLARWLEAHRLVRFLAFLPVLPFFILSMCTFRSRPRPSAAHATPRTRDGARILDSARTDPDLGMTDGPGLGWDRDGWSIEVRAWRGRDGRRVVARAISRSSAEFGFAAHSTAGLPGFLRAPIESATTSIARRAIEADDEKRLGGSDSGTHEPGAGLRTVDFIGRPPIDPGAPDLERMLVVRAADPGAMRALLAVPEVRQALGDLEATHRRWEWTLYPTRQAGIMEMRFTAPDATSGYARSKRIVDLLHASLAHLARTGVLRSD